ncbi:MAG: ParB N-terminal domain-containing protein [Thermogutta sp.]|nr:ParB N-terminal domain-containing protein [Thermogutta sp.]
MHIRDRIKELRRVPAKSLRPNPRNWRTHPKRQQEALRGVLAEIGYADALLARELEDGSLELIDGHLRAETTPEALVPVLVLDVSAEEAAKLLAVLDPLANLAGKNEDVLRDLLSDVETAHPGLQTLLDELAGDDPAANGGGDAAGEADGESEPPLPDVFQIVVQCRDEDQQRELFERLTGEGFSCRLVNL